MPASSTTEWPSREQFESDAALVVVAAVMGFDATFIAPDAEYAERVYARAERIVRKLETIE